MVRSYGKALALELAPDRCALGVVHLRDDLHNWRVKAWSSAQQAPESECGCVS